MTGRLPLLGPYASANNTARVSELSKAQRPRPTHTGRLRKGVSVVILNLDKPELILPLLDQLETQRDAFRARGLELQLLVGDTGSTDARVLARYDASRDSVEVMRRLTYQFSRCNNQVARDAADCEVLLFLNNDVVFPSDSRAILDMYDGLMARPDVGVVGPYLFFADGTLQHGGVDFSRASEIRGLCFHPHTHERLSEEHLPSFAPVPAVTGAFLMVRTDLYWTAGAMDEGYAAECQDIALCLAAHRLGWRTMLAYTGHIVHLENATRKKGEENWPDRQRFIRKWGSYIEACFL
jgi:GT2 family glycosyltransferase